MPFGYQKAPLAAAAGTQPGRRESGAEKKHGGGGGLIDSGRRTFVPNVLGRDPRPPLVFYHRPLSMGVFFSFSLEPSNRQ
jgi:hypothetical protein